MIKSKRNLENPERKKYKLLPDDSIRYRGRTLYRIQSLRDFSNVKEGDLGGYVESEDNLSHYDNCWIYDNARAMDSARVIENARLKEFSVIKDQAVILGNASAWSYSEICDNSSVRDYSRITDSATISGKAIISGTSEIHADVSRNAFIGDRAIIQKDSDYFIVDQPLDDTFWDSLTFYTGFDRKIYITSYPSRTPLDSEALLAVVRFRHGRFSKQYKQAKMLVKYAKQRIL